MADQEIAHYGALIRLQVALSALQGLLKAAPEGFYLSDDVFASDDGKEKYQKARYNAAAAVQILLGGQHEVPEALMADWTDAQMKRDAAKVLAESAR